MTLPEDVDHAPESGELLVSADAWRVASLSETSLEVRQLSIAGRVEVLETFALSGARLAANLEPARQNRT